MYALCGVTAGGSEAALALHFSSPVNGGVGDLGEMRDGSKETVLVLCGILVCRISIFMVIRVTPIGGYETSGR
jgi:hypothetical protein